MSLSIRKGSEPATPPNREPFASQIASEQGKRRVYISTSCSRHNSLCRTEFRVSMYNRNFRLAIT